MFLHLVPIAHQRHERRDATGLCDRNSVVVIRCENRQRGGGETVLRVVPIAYQRHELCYVSAIFSQHRRRLSRWRLRSWCIA